MASLMATQTNLRRRPTAAFPLPSAFIHRLPVRVSFSPLPKSLKRRRISCSISPPLQASPIRSVKTPNSNPDFLSGSTRTVTTLFAIGLTVSKLFAQGFFNLAVQYRKPLVYSAGPLFFASLRDPFGSSTRGPLNTPLTVVCAGVAKWLDIYGGVMMIRVMLSWFPNIPWDRQPLSAIRDLCDPYLNLFRNIIPPVFNSLDISPLFAFAVLGVLARMMENTRYG